MNIGQLLIGTILIESIVNAVKLIYDKDKRLINWDIIVSVIIAIPICIVAKFDLFALFGLEMGIPVVAQVATGIILSRGANFVHDLIKLIQGLAINQIK